MGNHPSHHSPSSSSPSSPSKPSLSRRTHSWTSRTSSSSATPSTPSTSAFSSPSIEKHDQEFTFPTKDRDYDVKERHRPLRVGYPYYEDVLWEAELASQRRACPKEKRRRKKNMREGRGFGG